mmetsp:Transcript_19453/g.41117  ORF Transcript_19453/g.41117 Transcript_19453/m.41117 type:complete len:724 (-) Transcript_19453:417-2588(-)
MRAVQAVERCRTSGYGGGNLESESDNGAASSVAEPGQLDRDERIQQLMQALELGSDVQAPRMPADMQRRDRRGSRGFEHVPPQADECYYGQQDDQPTSPGAAQVLNESIPLDASECIEPASNEAELVDEEEIENSMDQFLTMEALVFDPNSVTGVSKHVRAHASPSHPHHLQIQSASPSHRAPVDSPSPSKRGQFKPAQTQAAFEEQQRRREMLQKQQRQLERQLAELQAQQQAHLQAQQRAEEKRQSERRGGTGQSEAGTRERFQERRGSQEGHGLQQVYDRNAQQETKQQHHQRGQPHDHPQQEPPSQQQQQQKQVREHREQPQQQHRHPPPQRTSHDKVARQEGRQLPPPRLRPPNGHSGIPRPVTSSDAPRSDVPLTAEPSRPSQALHHADLPCTSMTEEERRLRESINRLDAKLQLRRGATAERRAQSASAVDRLRSATRLAAELEDKPQPCKRHGLTPCSLCIRAANEPPKPKPKPAPKKAPPLPPTIVPPPRRARSASSGGRSYAAMNGLRSRVTPACADAATYDQQHAANAERNVVMSARPQQLPAPGYCTQPHPQGDVSYQPVPGAFQGNACAQQLNQPAAPLYSAYNECGGGTSSASPQMSAYSGLQPQFYEPQPYPVFPPPHLQACFNFAPAVAPPKCSAAQFLPTALPATSTDYPGAKGHAMHAGVVGTGGHPPALAAAGFTCSCGTTEQQNTVGTSVRAAPNAQALLFGS